MAARQAVDFHHVVILQHHQHSLGDGHRCKKAEEEGYGLPKGPIGRLPSHCLRGLTALGLDDALDDALMMH
jgi:hypothetical protein